MYAVVKTGGKQYRVSPGDTLRVELLNAEEGDEVTLDQVLMMNGGDSVTIGTPLVENASVSAKVLQHGRAKKVEIIKFRRRKHHQKRTGHRQHFTEIEITGINGKGVKAAAPAKKAPAKKEEAPAPAKEAPKAAPKGPTGTVKFMDAPQGEPDNLKDISGVGPVLEKALNSLGIYHFSQIAAFTAEDIEAVENETNFPGRIERDEWIKQAAELAKGKS